MTSLIVCGQPDRSGGFAAFPDKFILVFLILNAHLSSGPKIRRHGPIVQQLEYFSCLPPLLT